MDWGIWLPLATSTQTSSARTHPFPWRPASRRISISTGDDDHFLDSARHRSRLRLFHRLRFSLPSRARLYDWVRVLLHQTAKAATVARLHAWIIGWGWGRGGKGHCTRQNAEWYWPKWTVTWLSYSTWQSNHHVLLFCMTLKIRRH